MHHGFNETYISMFLALLGCFNYNGASYLPMHNLSQESQDNILFRDFIVNFFGVLKNACISTVICIKLNPSIIVSDIVNNFIAGIIIKIFHNLSKCGYLNSVLVFSLEQHVE